MRTSGGLKKKAPSVTLAETYFQINDNEGKYRRSVTAGPVLHSPGSPGAGAMREVIGQSWAATLRKSSSLTARSFHQRVSAVEAYAPTFETEEALEVPGRQCSHPADGLRLLGLTAMRTLQPWRFGVIPRRSRTTRSETCS
jgi:hypothetical protein